MAYKLRGKEVFEVKIKDTNIVFVCFSQDTRNAYRHIAIRDNSYSEETDYSAEYVGRN